MKYLDVLLHGHHDPGSLAAARRVSQLVNKSVNTFGAALMLCAPELLEHDDKDDTNVTPVFMEPSDVVKKLNAVKQLE